MKISSFPRRQIAAFGIAAGGVMHLIALYQAYCADALEPMWWVVTFSVFGVVYPLSAVVILKRVAWGLWVSLLVPTFGGVAILIGILYPDTGLMILNPGTFDGTLTVMGFLAPLCEAIAAILALEILIDGWKS